VTEKRGSLFSLSSTVRYLAAEAGVRQLLDLGTSIPSADNTHEVAQQTLRTRDQVARFFTGLELVPPGLVQVHQWRPDPEDDAPEGTVSAHGGVGRKAS
jgi:hypothetical protein